MSSLTARLLVAVPADYDSGNPDIFVRSVIFVLHHDADGAQGLVLTCPLEAGVDDVLPGWQQLASQPDRLFQGGPVGLDMAIALANVPGRDDVVGIQRLYGALALVDLDAPQPLIQGVMAGMRIFAGSAGWDAGQLDKEIDDDQWIVVDSEIGDMFDADPATLWKRVLLRQRGDNRFLATYPDDPSLN